MNKKNNTLKKKIFYKTVGVTSISFLTPMAFAPFTKKTVKDLTPNITKSQKALYTKSYKVDLDDLYKSQNSKTTKKTSRSSSPSYYHAPSFSRFSYAPSVPAPFSTSSLIVAPEIFDLTKIKDVSLYTISEWYNYATSSAGTRDGINNFKYENITYYRRRNPAKGVNGYSYTRLETGGNVEANNEDDYFNNSASRKLYAYMDLQNGSTPELKSFSLIFGDYLAFQEYSGNYPGSSSIPGGVLSNKEAAKDIIRDKYNNGFIDKNGKSLIFSVNNIVFNDPANDQAKESTVSFDIDYEGGTKNQTITIRYAKSNEDVLKERELTEINSNFGKINSQINSYLSSHRDGNDSVREAIASGLDATKFNTLVQSVLRNYPGYEIESASYDGTWSNEWASTSVPLKYKIKFNSTYNGNRISSEYNATHIFIKTPFEVLLESDSNFGFERFGTVDLGSKNAIPSSDVPLNPNQINENYIKAILGSGPYDNVGVAINNIVYSKPSNDSNKATVSFDIKAGTEVQKYSFEINWTKSINDQIIEDFNIDDLKPKFDLTSFPVSTSVGMDENQYLIENNNNSIIINNVSGYSFNGSEVTDFTVDIEIKLGSSTRTISKSFTFAKKVLDQKVETILSNIRDNLSSNDIIISGVDANDFTLELPSYLSKSTLAASGLELLMSVDGGAYENAHSYNGQSSSSEILFNDWTSSAIKKFPNIRFRVALINPADPSRHIDSKFSTEFAQFDSASISGVRIYIDTSKNLLTGISVSGATNDFSISGDVTIQDGANDGAETVYTLSNWGTPSSKLLAMGVKAEMTKAEIEAIFDGSNGRYIWDIVNRSMATLKAKLIPGTSAYVISSNNEFTIPLNNLKIYVDVSKAKSDISNGLKVLTSGDSDQFTWNSQLAIIRRYLDERGMKLEFSTNGSTWSVSEPTSIDFAYNSRNIYVRILPKSTSGNYISSDVSSLNISSTSGIRDIKGRVDTSTAPDLSNVSLTDHTYNLTWNNIPSAKPGSKIVFSINDGGMSSGWLEQSAFKSWIKNNGSKLDVSKIRAKYVVTNSSNYTIRSGESREKTVITDDFYNYIDVDSLVAQINNITYSGIIDKPNNFAYALPTEISDTELANLNLKLQYWTIDKSGNGSWKDAQTGSVSSDPQNNIDASNDGELITIIKNKDGTSTLKWRIVPVVGYQSGHKTMPTTAITYSEFMEATRVVLSDYIKNGKSESGVEIDASGDLVNLPTLVTTETSDLGDITVGDNSLEILINEQVAGQTYDSYLKSINQNKPDYSASVILVYSVNINGQRIWMRKADFERWLASNATTSMRVWYGTNKYEEGLKSGDLTPDWNKLNTSSFQVKWTSIDDKYIVTNGTPTNITSDSNFKKFIVVEKWLDDLRKINITGDTHHLRDNNNTIDQILRDLHAAVGASAGDLEIEITYLKNGSLNPDWTRAVSVSSTDEFNSLIKMNFDKEMFFRVVNKTGSSKYLISTTSEKSVFNAPFSEWNGSSRALIKRWVKFKKSEVENKVVLSGNTKTISEAINVDFLHFDINGEHTTNKTYEGIDVYYSLNAVAGQNINTTPMPFEVFEAYLDGTLTVVGSTLMINGSVYNGAAGTFGFNSRNYRAPKFDGKWGREKISLHVVPRKGYDFDASLKTEIILSNTSKIISQLKRFVNIDNFINDLQTGSKKIQVEGNKTDSWWDYTTGTFTNTSDNEGNEFGSYIDSKNLNWSRFNIPTDYKIKVQYSTDNGSTWVDTLPKSTGDNKSSRKLLFKIIPNGKYDSGEEVDFSSANKNDIDITVSSRINIVPTNITVGNIDLSQVSISGSLNWRGSNVTIADVSVPANTKIVYTLTGFTDLDKSKRPTTELLDAMQLSHNDSSINKLKTAGYKASMTKQEFLAFLNNAYKNIIVTGYNESAVNSKLASIYRNLIKVRIRANDGYSIHSSDISRSVAVPQTDNLYTYRDVKNFIDKMVLKDDNDPQSGIHLQGKKTLTDGVAVFLPDSLTPDNLAKYGLKLQWTTTSPDGQSIDSSPQWNDVVIVPISADESGGITWDSATAHGFKVTLLPKSGNNAFLALRLVPDKNEEGLQKVPSDINSVIQEYFDATKTTLYEGSDKIENDYKIDTSKIPTVVKTETLQSHLSDITFTGNTHNIKVNIDRTQVDKWIDDDNPADRSLKSNVYILYSIDKNENGEDVWLLKEDFEAYLNGELSLSGNNVINNNTGKVVEALSTDLKVSPDYNQLNLGDIKVKLTGGKDAQGKSYIPSTVVSVKGNFTVASSSTDSTNSLQKWIDATDTLEKLRDMKIENDTNDPLDEYGSKSRYITDLLQQLFSSVNSFGTGSNTLQVEVTYDFDGSGNPTFNNASKVSINELNHLDFTKRLAFRFKKSGSEKFFISTSSAHSSEMPMIIWGNQNSKDNLLKFVHVKKDDLSKVILTGNTHILLETNDSNFDKIINSDVNGNPISNGSYEGIDVWYSLTNIAGQAVNTNKMPFEVFQAYLAGTLTLSGGSLRINGITFNDYPGNLFGFTASNISKPEHNGKWGREKFRLWLNAEEGYKFDGRESTAYIPTETSLVISGIKRFIDVTDFVNGLQNPSDNNSIKVNAKSITGSNFWWDYTTGTFTNPEDNLGTNFGSYVDSKNLKWNDVLVPNEFKVKIQYSVDGAQTWSDNLPTETTDGKSSRKLHFKLIVNGKYTSGEEAEWSSTNERNFNVASSSRLDKVPTNISVNPTRLPQSILSGNLNHLLNSGKDLSDLDIVETNVIANTKLVYTLTNFTDLDINLGPTQNLLQAIGLPETSASISILETNGYKAEMTSAEFRKFLNNIYTNVVKTGYNESASTNRMIGVSRKLISIRLRPNKGYSITKPDLITTTTKPNTDNLYTYRDISQFTSKLELSEDTDHNSGIHIQGRKTVTNGAVIFLPDILIPDNLAKYGLKLQWTTTSDDGLVIGSSPTWNDVDVSENITADQAAGIKWGSSTAKGFKVTLTPKAGNNAFFALRLVPDKNEEDISKTPTSKDGDINTYFDSTKTTLYDAKNKAKNDYGIDTSKIPTVVTTVELQNNLDTIEFVGNTHQITVKEDRSKIDDWIDSDNVADPTLKNYIEVRYSIDENPDGSRIWLPKNTFEAYLNGGLTMSGNKVIFKSNRREVPELTAAKRAQPDYNNLDLKDIRVKLFGGNDADGKSYTPSTDAEVAGLYSEWTSGKTATNSLRKWIDVTKVLDDLKKMEIKNDTFDPLDKYDKKGQYIDELLSNLFNDVDIYGTSNVFQVEITYDFDSAGNPKFDNASKVSINELKHLDFTKRLAFRFKKAGAEKFFISTSNDFSKESPMIIWDNKISKDNLLKFVHVKKDDLSKVILTGNTHILLETNDSNFDKIINSDVNGNPISNGSYEGIDVWYSLTNIAGQAVNTNKMPFEVFQAYLAGTLTLGGGSLRINGIIFNDYPGNLFGFTASNISKPEHNGKWGREKFRLWLNAEEGYKFDAIESSQYIPNAVSSNVVKEVNRFINIDQYIDDLQNDDNANHIRVFSKETSGSSFWWDYVTGTFRNPEDNSGTNFGSYVDSKNLIWGVTTVPSEYKIKIQYSIDGVNWTDNPPKTTLDNKSSRKLLFKVVSDGEYGNEETAEFSQANQADFDVTISSKLNIVSTNVAKGTTDLSKIDFTGTLNWHSTSGKKLSDFDINEVSIPDHTEIVYTLSKFSNLDITRDEIIELFAALGLPANNTSISTLKGYGYKAEMTAIEFRTFLDNVYVNIIKTGHKKESNGSVTLIGLPFSHIETRLRAEKGYSITQDDLTSLRTKPKTQSLYGYRDISEFSSLIQDINLFGQKTTTNGVVVVLPNNLSPNNLRKYGLKLQWTTDSKNNTSGEGVLISDTPRWMDAMPTTLPQGKVAGSPQTDNGFTITITPQKNNDALLSFRFVPISGTESGDSVASGSDLETSKTNMSDVQGELSKWTMQEYFDATRIKLYDAEKEANTLASAKYKGYRVDTNSIPTVIKTDKEFLKTIEFTGDTHHVRIHEDTDGSGTGNTSIFTKIDGINSDATLSSHLDILYAIDNKDGTPLENTPAYDDKAVLWLTAEDFTAYMNHDSKNPTLRIDSISKQVYNISTNKEIVALSEIFSQTGRFNPEFRTLNIDHIYSKFIANDFTKKDGKIQRFIPEDPGVMKVTVTKGKTANKSFRKWLSGKTIINEIKRTIIKGTTQSNSTWYLSRDDKDDVSKTLEYLSDAQLKLMNLKVEYSFDGNNWHDRADHIYNTYALIKNRHMYMRVIPDGTENNTDDEINIDYEGVSNFAEANINATDSHGDKLFKMYIDLKGDLLSQIIFEGNTYRLQDVIGRESEGLIENIAAGPNGVIPQDYIDGHDIEIQYLYKGTWYNKIELLAIMDQLRREPKDKDLQLPTDFTHEQVLARWRILDTREAVIVDGEKDSTTGTLTGNSPSQKTTTTKLLTFVNIWDIQNAVNPIVNPSLSANFVFTDGQNQGKNNPYFTLQGSVNSIKLKWSSQMIKWLADHHMRVEWSNKESPSYDIHSNDWQPASDTKYESSNDVKEDSNNIVDIALNPVHKSLWIRFVPEDQTSTDESTKWFASSRTIGPKNEQKIIGIGIDTDNLTFEVDVTNDALKAITFIRNGNSNAEINTQNYFSASLTNYLERNFNGITPKTVNEKGELIELDKTDEANIIQWLSDVGLSVFFRVKQTRTDKDDTQLIGKKDGEGYIVYETLAELQRDLRSKKLNFDRSTLQIKFGILKDKSNKYSVSDSNWVTPNDVSGIINVVYTEDVYLLHNKSYLLGGNTIVADATLSTDVGIGKHEDPSKIDKNDLAKLGLKIVWTTDKDSMTDQPSATAKWHDDIEANFNELPQHKGVWIKYVPIDSNYKVANDSISSGDQLTKLDAEQVKIAVVLDADFMRSFNTMHIDPVSTTLAPKMIGQPNLTPTPITDGEFKYVYSLGTTSISGDVIWKDKIGENGSGKDHGILLDSYGINRYSLDKDREKSFKIKMFINDESQFVFTNVAGIAYKPEELEKDIEIDKIQQPVYIKDNLKSIAGNKPKLKLPSLPSGVNTWEEFAQDSKFLPDFSKGSSSTNADLYGFSFDGKTLTVDKKSDFFGWGMNPFNENDNATRDVMTNALAPRHTHFEFIIRDENDPSFDDDKKKRPDDDLQTSTQTKTLRVVLVADDGYYLPDDQTWSRDFNVVLVSTTTNMAIGTTNEDEKSISFIGFETPNGVAKPALYDPLNPTNPNMGVPNLKFVTYIDDGNGTLVPTTLTLSDLFQNDSFSLEWNVVDKNGNEIPWTDQKGTKAAGWHEFPEPPDPEGGKTDYENNGGKYGRYPVSLKNGNKVLIRLRANNGWVIRDRNNVDSSARIPNTEYYLKYSHVLTYEFNTLNRTNPTVIDDAIVKNLPKKIVIPTDYGFEPTGWMKDRKGVSISVRNVDNPKVTFINADGYGEIVIDYGNPGDANRKLIKDETNVLTQILRPWKPETTFEDESPIDYATLRPVWGYEMLTIDSDGNKEWKLVAVTKTGYDGLTPDQKNDLFASGSTLRTNEGRMAWVQDADIIKDSWINVNDVDFLKSAWALRFKLEVKDNSSYAFEWEGQRGKWEGIVDSWIPKDDTRQLFNKNDDYDETEADASYYPVTVTGLQIKPQWEPTDSSLELVYLPVDGFTSPYQGKAIVQINKMPTSSDLWRWEYSLNGGGTWIQTLPQNISNGTEITVRATFKGGAQNGAFTFDKTYDNTPRAFTISGLKDMISTATIPRPILQIGGFQGKGYLTSLLPHFTDDRNTPYLTTGETYNGVLLPEADAGPDSPSHNGLKWQFQVSHVNPDGISQDRIDSLPWTDEPPSNLVVGDFVRARLTTKDNKEKVEPTIYSYTEVEKLDEDGNVVIDVNGNPVMIEGNKDGWQRVKDLKVNANNVDIEVSVQGYIKDTFLSYKFLKNLPDELGIKIEASFMGKDEWHDLTYFEKLDNYDTDKANGELEFRAVAKNGYIIPVGVEYNNNEEYNSEAPNPIYFSGTDGVNYIQLPSWKNYKVEKLLEYIDVRKVSFKDVEIVRDASHPDMNESEMKKQFPDFKPEDVLSDYAKVVPKGAMGEVTNALQEWLEKINTIKDRDGNDASDKVKIVFVVSKFDPFSGAYTQLPESELLPIGLSNMDQVKIKVVPVDPNVYKLSSDNLELNVGIRDLVQLSPKLSKKPTMIFRGDNGEGTVSITPSPPKGYIWEYQIKDGETGEVTDFDDNPPVNLKNGDEVKVRIRSAIPGVKIGEDYETDYYQVSGLLTKIDLSDFTLDSVDKILSIIGNHESSAYITGENPEIMKDSVSEKPIPFKDKLEWRYYVTEDESDIPNESSRYTDTRPTKLKNGQFIRAILVSTDQKYQVYGFNPISIEVVGLVPSATVSNRLLIVFLGIGAGVLVISGATAFVFIVRRKKRRNL